LGFFEFKLFQKISRKKLPHFQTQPLHFHIRTSSVSVWLLHVEFKDRLQDWDSSQTVTWGMYGPKLSDQSLYRAILLFKSHWEAQSWNLRHCNTCHHIELVLNFLWVLCIPSITQFHLVNWKSK